jgi:hypothetical protein
MQDSTFTPADDHSDDVFQNPLSPAVSGTVGTPREQAAAAAATELADAKASLQRESPATTSGGLGYAGGWEESEPPATRSTETDQAERSPADTERPAEAVAPPTEIRGTEPTRAADERLDERPDDGVEDLRRSDERPEERPDDAVEDLRRSDERPEERPDDAVEDLRRSDEGPEEASVAERDDAQRGDDRAAMLRDDERLDDSRPDEATSAQPPRPDEQSHAAEPARPPEPPQPAQAPEPPRHDDPRPDDPRHDDRDAADAAAMKQAEHTEPIDHGHSESNVQRVIDGALSSAAGHSPAQPEDHVAPRAPQDDQPAREEHSRQAAEHEQELRHQNAETVREQELAAHQEAEHQAAQVEQQALDHALGEAANDGHVDVREAQRAWAGNFDQNDHLRELWHEAVGEHPDTTSFKAVRERFWDLVNNDHGAHAQAVREMVHLAGYDTHPDTKNAPTWSLEAYEPVHADDQGRAKTDMTLSIDHADPQSKDGAKLEAENLRFMSQRENSTRGAHYTADDRDPKAEYDEHGIRTNFPEPSRETQTEQKAFRATVERRLADRERDQGS